LTLEAKAKALTLEAKATGPEAKTIKFVLEAKVWPQRRHKTKKYNSNTTQKRIKSFIFIEAAIKERK